MGHNKSNYPDSGKTPCPGSEVVMTARQEVATHAENQAFWKDSEIGKKLGLSKVISDNSGDTTPA